MSILADKDTRVLVQGITGAEGAFHTAEMVKYGTQIVAGVTPGKGGQWIQGLPIFDTVRGAVAATGAEASVIYVPAPLAADAIMEAADAKLELIVCITEGIPVADMVKVKRALQHKPTYLIGPNCPGLITPTETKLGIMPGAIFQSGPVGVVSRSGTLIYEFIQALKQRDIGQSTAVGIGADPIIGTNFVEILHLFDADPLTDHIILIGEIGGPEEQHAAEFIGTTMHTPVTAFIAGKHAPWNRRMGHAGAIIHDEADTAKRKISLLKEAGVRVYDLPEEVIDRVERSLQRRRFWDVNNR